MGRITATLPGLFAQFYDPTILGASALHRLVEIFGYAAATALCAALAALAIVLVAQCTRERGATEWCTLLAAVLTVLCFWSRLGVSLEPFAWLCAAAVTLLLGRRDRIAAYGVPAIVLLWSLLQGGATFGALLALVAAIGSVLDERAWNARVQRATAIAAVSVAASLVTAHGFATVFYGARALYLDALLPGGERVALWQFAPTPAMLGFFTIVVLAGWFGIWRRGATADLLTFVAAMLLALNDARMLPFFAIVAAPIAARAWHNDSTAHYRARYRPVAIAASVVAVLAFVMIVAAVAPKRTVFLAEASVPQSLVAVLALDRGTHRVLCMHPVWCNAVDAANDPRMTALVDDRTGLASPRDRDVQAQVIHASDGWVMQLARAHVDAVIAPGDAPVVAILRASSGWRISERDRNGRVLVRFGAPR